MRQVVSHRGLLQRLMYESHLNERKRFGLDPQIEQRLDEDHEMESMIKFESEEQVFITDLPWYILNPKNTLYKVLTTVI